MSTPPKGRADFLQLGDWNAVCFECGRKRKASSLRKHWQGYYVCPEHWEPRHPQDFVKARPDQAGEGKIPWGQPPIDIFPEPFGCPVEGKNAVPGFSIPGCMVPARYET